MPIDIDVIIFIGLRTIVPGVGLYYIIAFVVKIAKKIRRKRE